MIAFAEGVPAPPQHGEEVAQLVPGARFPLLDGLGHGSWYGHLHDRINAYLETIIRDA